MRTRVKICGITSSADARAAAGSGVDFLGFNFYPRSPRYVTPAKARRILRSLPKRVKAVGVFVDARPGEILRTAAAVGLWGVQLHGAESPRTVAAVARKLPVWKAVRVRGRIRPAQLRKYAADAILLDGFKRGMKGGTGRVFDWAQARRAAREFRIVLAGGLTSEQVAQAIRAARPYAVDVASGVESHPGRKDARKMRAFVRAVRKGK
jgi:phosphoribosylanthranilate isomerase